MIVIFSHAHPSVSKGGAEVSAYTLYLGLRALGQPAAFVAMCPEAQASRVRLETEHEHIIIYRPENYDHLFHFAEPGTATAALEILESLKPSALLFHHFLFLGIDTIRRISGAYPTVPRALVLHEFLAICHHHGQMVTRPAKRFCSKPGLTECNNCFPEYAPEEFGIRADFFRTTINQLSHVVSPSHFLAERFAKWGVDATKLAVIENGLAGYSPEPRAAQTVAPPEPTAKRKAGAAPKAATAINQGPLVFGYFGQINPFKGIDQIMDAVDLLDPATQKNRRISVRVHGNVVGVSAEFEARFRKMTAPGSVMQYTGPYNNADVHQLMAACDYIVMASTWWENSPVVIQEAYAAGRPVICPGFGGMAEKVVNGRTGFHFKPNDPQSLATLMQECANGRDKSDLEIPTPATAEEMAQNYLRLIS